MLASEIAINQLRRIVMAGAAILDLVNGRNSRRQIGDLMYVVRGAVAIITASLALVSAAADRSLDTPVALAATLIIGQRLEIGIFMLDSDVGVALLAGNIGMCRRRIRDVLMTLGAVDILRCGRKRAQGPEKRCHNEVAGVENVPDHCRNSFGLRY